MNNSDCRHSWLTIGHGAMKTTLMLSLLVTVSGSRAGCKDTLTAGNIRIPVNVVTPCVT